MPKKLTKEQMRKYQQNRRARLRNVKPGVKPGVKPSESVKPGVKPNIPNVKPLGLPLKLTGSTCDIFETLPKDVQDQINRLSPEEGEGAGPSGINRTDRIFNAIHYQQFVRAA